MPLDRRQGAPDYTTVADGQGSIDATDAPRKDTCSGQGEGMLSMH